MEDRELIFKTYQKISEFKDVLKQKDDFDKENFEYIDALEQQFLETSCRIAVVGEFKRGKTSFINAILGKKILPEAVSPWTAVETEIVFSETESAQIWIEGNEIKEIQISELEGWITKSEQQLEKAQKARLKYPSSFLFDNDVILVDTPGLNDHECLDTITLKAACSADILIWMLSNSSPFSNSELNYVINFIRNSEARHVIFVMNKIDMLDNEDIEMLLKTVCQRINEMTKDMPERKQLFFNGKVPIFGFSAKNALKARKLKSLDLLQESRLSELEEALEEIIYITCYEKQTEKVLEVLVEQCQDEIERCNVKKEKWMLEFEKMEQGISSIERIDSYFHDNLIGDIVNQTESLIGNYKESVWSLEHMLQSYFHQNIYSRGYTALSACCNTANQNGNEQRIKYLNEINIKFRQIYSIKKEEFSLWLSKVMEKSNIEEGFLNEAELKIDVYKSVFNFKVLNFPGLLLKKNPVSRETYIDNIVREEVCRVSVQGEKNINKCISDIIEKTEKKEDALVKKYKKELEEKKCHYEKCVDDLINGKFYISLLEMLNDIDILIQYIKRNCT